MRWRVWTLVAAVTSLGAAIGALVLSMREAERSSDAAAPSRGHAEPVRLGERSVTSDQAVPLVRPNNPAMGAAEPPNDPKVVFADALEAASDRPRPPAEARQAIEDALAATGPTQERWASVATDTFSRLAIEMEATFPKDTPRPVFRNPRCYRAGCAVDVTFPAGVDFFATVDRMAFAKSVQAWPGPKMTSPAVGEPGKEMVATWILLRPDEAAHEERR